MDELTVMLLNSPTFSDETGHFPEQNLDNSIGALNDGLDRLRHQLGDDLYHKLRGMSDQMRSYFEADPDEVTGETRKGKNLVYAMEELVKARIASIPHSDVAALAQKPRGADIIEGREPASHRPYIPQTPGELFDLLGLMMLRAPTFVDYTGYFPERDIDMVFYALERGLNAIRRKISEERYGRLVEMSDRARLLFATDPEDKTGESDQGRRLIYEMMQLVGPTES